MSGAGLMIGNNFLDDQVPIIAAKLGGLASSPGHSHVFNVARRKEGGPGI